MSACSSQFDRGAGKRPRILTCSRKGVHSIHWTHVGGAKIRSGKLFTWDAGSEMKGGLAR